MMTLQLIKKDFLLARTHILIAMGLSVLIPLIVMVNVPIVTGAVAFIYTVVFATLLSLQSVASVEAKFPKAVALLCASPYSRNSFVMAKYACFYLLFAYCYVVYALLGLFFPTIEAINLSVVLAVLMFGTIIYSVYLPVYFKLGFERTKFFFLIVVLIIAYGMPMLINLSGNLNLYFFKFFLLPAAILNSMMLITSIVVFAVSMNLSMRIFSKKEL